MLKLGNHIVFPGGMKHGFFGYLGNKIHFTIYDLWFWIIFATLCVLLIITFKTKIYNWYHKKNRKAYVVSLGAIILLVDCFSRIMFSISGYPRHWEIIPLHLCRLVFTILGLFLFFNKPAWIKWIVFATILGATLAITKAALNSTSQNNWYCIINGVQIPYSPFSQGIDNYFYWDYYLTHVTLLVSTIYLWVVFRWKYTIKEVIILIFGGFLLTVSAFILNIIINAINPEEKADYFYQGEYSAVKLPSFLGKLLWPYSLVTWTFVNIILSSILYLLWVASGKVNIAKWEWNKENPNKIVLGSWKPILQNK